MIVFGVDPGTTRAGWCIYNTSTQTFLSYGHDDWNIVRDKLKSSGAQVCAVEQVIIYQGTPGSQRLMPMMIQHIGRLTQICEDNMITFTQIPRIQICQLITGIRPRRGHKISKSFIQKSIQEKLGLDKPIRPLHCSDATAVVIALYPPKPIDK